MRKYAASLSAVVLPVFTVIFLAACGSSPGGSGFGGGSSGGLVAVCGNLPGVIATSGDQTPPVTTVDRPTGSYDPNTIITYTCNDNDTGCDVTYLSRVIRGSSSDYYPYYNWQISGATSTSFTIKISGASSGTIYEYCFYSTDKNGNDETPTGKVYTIN